MKHSTPPLPRTIRHEVIELSMMGLMTGLTKAWRALLTIDVICQRHRPTSD